jgi:hypothetical protein
VSACRRCGRRAVRLSAAVVLVGIAVAAGPAAAGSVAAVAALSWGILRWRSIEERLLPLPARRTVAGHRAATAELPAEQEVPDALGLGARQVVVRVVEVAFLAPQDGGVR